MHTGRQSWCCRSRGRPSRPSRSSFGGRRRAAPPATGGGPRCGRRVASSRRRRRRGRGLVGVVAPAGLRVGVLRLFRQRISAAVRTPIKSSHSKKAGQLIEGMLLGLSLPSIICGHVHSQTAMESKVSCTPAAAGRRAAGRMRPAGARRCEVRGHRSRESRASRNPLRHLLRHRRPCCPRSHDPGHPPPPPPPYESRPLEPP